jgi:plastocyanin
MRTFVVSVAAVLALAVTGASQSASTAVTAVKISATAFTPATVTIATGAAVKWTNGDTKSHQVVANNGSFASGSIAKGKSYSHTFNTAGTFNYHDALHPTLKGKVVVKGPPPDVSIGATAPILNFGQATHIGGAISSKQAGETVTLWAQPWAQASPVLAATLLTGTNGVWDFVVQPSTLTVYEAHWKTRVSDKIDVLIRPVVRLSANRRVGFVRVGSYRSLAGRTVYIQRLTRFKEWVKIRRVVLSSGSKKHFFLRLPRGRYQLRAFIQGSQVGAGYLDAVSGTVRVRVRHR